MTQIEQSTITSGLFCPACGYDLRGIESERCPECGLAIDRATIGQSVIPWTHRKRIGRFRAFWRTVAMAMHSPGKLAQDVARPVSYRDAQLFRWIVVLIVALPLCVAATWGALTNADTATRVLSLGMMTAPMSPRLDLLICAIAGAGTWYVPSIAVLLLVAGLTGAGSYWFHPKSIPVVQQNRAIAISYYACGPLVLLVIPYPAFAAAEFLAFSNLSSPSELFMLFRVLLTVGWASLPVIVFLWWLSTLRMLAAATHCSTMRVFGAGVCLPMMWLVLTSLALGVFPMICGFIKLVILSYAG